MKKLNGKKIVVIGGGNGTGLAIVHALLQEGADVLVVDLDAAALGQLKEAHSELSVLHSDATDEATAAQVLAGAPDVVVLAAGALPPLQPVHALDWDAFSTNWHVDVKAAFHLAQQALTAPAKSGTQIIFLSSGAAIFGSPITGGYAGAKRTQMFLANYAQESSNRLGLGLRFCALAPWRLMQGTRVAALGIPAYAAYMGLPPEAFTASRAAAQTKEDVAAAVVGFAAAAPALEAGNVFVVSGMGVVAESDVAQTLLKQL